MVLTVLYPTGEAGRQEALKVDIVAVHGLNGDPTETWTDSKTKVLWLRDYLPLDIAGARVMTFGYNANVAFGNTTADIIDHAGDLLSSLIDKREWNGEAQRPIVFIAHSLGGIAVKQALFQARIEARYGTINDNTVGIVFLGTPHRGSEKADYGHILAKVAATVINKPSSRLTKALQTNSRDLLRLTSEFRHQLSKYQVVSFYEMKPTKGFSSLIVEKHSALLEVDGEDQIPVDANHIDMCKFAARGDPMYEKLFIRLLRMLKAKDIERTRPSLQIPTSRNKHYELPRHVTPNFTGRMDISRKLKDSCLSSRMQDVPKVQRRFVLYGLGGSGKTQVCLKFAQDYRENFWGIFWIDASSNETAERAFLDIAQRCGLEGDFNVAKRWLANLEDPWLLIIDNADDPQMDVSKYFPTGDRGTILLTTRNPECKVHATNGSFELREMELEEAITLLLRITHEEGIFDSESRILAKAVVETLGCLALAIIQAGAVIRQRLCSMEEYCGLYSRRRKQLLSHLPVQAIADYDYTVYTTWEVSIKMIEDMSDDTSSNAIEILQLFCFIHYDGISEDILKEAWKNIHSQQRSEWTLSHQLGVLRRDPSQDWDPYLAREAINLLSSFSLVTLYGSANRISIHPLVASWARDRLSEAQQKQCWMKTASTLAISISWKYQTFDYLHRRFLFPHIDACLRLHSDSLFSEGDALRERLKMAAKFALAYDEGGLWQRAVELQERVLEVSKEILGEDDKDTWYATHDLANSYKDLGQMQKAMKLHEKVLEASKRILSEEHPDTLSAMTSLGIVYYHMGQMQKAMDLQEIALESRKRILGEEHPYTLSSMRNLANIYGVLGQVQRAKKLQEKALETRMRIQGEENRNTLSLMDDLTISYYDLSQVWKTIDLQEQVLESRKRILGEEHPETLWSMFGLAYSYCKPGQVQKVTESQGKVLRSRERILGEEHRDTLGSMDDVAVVYHDLGQSQEAIQLMEKGLEISIRTLGEQHPITVRFRDTLTVIRQNSSPSMEAPDQEFRSDNNTDTSLGEQCWKRVKPRGLLRKLGPLLGRK